MRCKFRNQYTSTKRCSAESSHLHSLIFLLWFQNNTPGKNITPYISSLPWRRSRSWWHRHRIANSLQDWIEFFITPFSEMTGTSDGSFDKLSELGSNHCVINISISKSRSLQSIKSWQIQISSPVRRMRLSASGMTSLKAFLEDITAHDQTLIDIKYLILAIYPF